MAEWRRRLRVLVLLLLGASAALQAQAAPQRIVSLLPSLTESVCALGACERLVGVDRYSNFPARVRRLPQLGGGLDPSLEAIVALQPDLVLMASSARVAERLQALGIRVLQLEPKTHADLHQALQTLARVLEVDNAEQVWRGIDAGVQAAGQSLSPQARRARVYFEVNRAPYAASEASFIGETLKRLGVANIVPGQLGPFPKLNPEFVVRANPSVIMVGDVEAAAGLAGRPGWDAIDAIVHHRVCVFTPAEVDVLVRAGPRLAEAAQLMARCLNGATP